MYFSNISSAIPSTFPRSRQNFVVRTAPEMPASPNAKPQTALYQNGLNFVLQRSSGTSAAGQLGSLPHLLWVPSYPLQKGKRRRDAVEAVPLLIFLHGAGEIGADLNMLLNAEGASGSVPQLLARGGHPYLPQYMVVMPQSPIGWTSDDASAAVVQLVNAYLRITIATSNTSTSWVRADRRRVYLTGLSNGGAGALLAALSTPPGLFDAVVPVCGFGSASIGDRLVSQRLRSYFVHGANDQVVPVESSDVIFSRIAAAENASKRVSVLHAALGDVRRTVVSLGSVDEFAVYERHDRTPDPEGEGGSSAQGHAAWRVAYAAESLLWQWLQGAEREPIQQPHNNEQLPLDTPERPSLSTIPTATGAPLPTEEPADSDS